MIDQLAAAPAWVWVAIGAAVVAGVAAILNRLRFGERVDEWLGPR